jgi:beta-lactamase class A
MSVPAVRAAVLAAACACAGADAQQPEVLGETLKAQFSATLERVAATADGVVGYAIVDLASGDRFARLETTPFPTASTIKLAILYELLRQVDAGAISIDTPAPLDRRRAVPGGLLYELSTPALSPRDLAVAMMLQSDNTATNVLIDRVGMAAVNKRMAALGLKGTTLRRYMIDLDAARRGDENVSTPADLATLVIALHRGEGLSAQAHAIALDILRKPKATPIRAGVPASVVVASKSGDLEGVRADAGIVEVPNRPYVFAAMATYLPVSDDDDPGNLEALARASYGYFSRRASISAYGRQIF